MRLTTTGRRARLAPAIGLAVIASVAACSTSSSSPSSTSTTHSSPAASAPAASAPASGGSGASAQIKTAWTGFFSSSASTSQREQLLQNGPQFATALTALGSIPVTSKVVSVTVNSPTKATVKYDLTAMGQTVASGQSGTAVLQNGTWKVGDDVLCGLLTQAKAVGMVSSVPAACSSAG